MVVGRPKSSAFETLPNWTMEMARQAINSEDLETKLPKNSFQVRKVNTANSLGPKNLCSALSVLRLCAILPAAPAAPGQADRDGARRQPTLSKGQSGGC
jgi:hypothetical protein